MTEDRDQEERVEAARSERPMQTTSQWLEPIYREHAGAVVQAAYRITGNADDAEDVLQTVFMRLARRSGPPDLVHGALPYLRRAAANAALDLVQSRRARSDTSLDGAPALLTADSAPSPERLQSSRELKDWLRTALASLSRRQAEMFVLRYFEDLDNQTIAGMYGTSPGTVAVTLHRVRSRLARELGPNHGGTR
jgi:RNA polymerase sigma-70 factor (ECF subfamily)